MGEACGMQKTQTNAGRVKERDALGTMHCCSGVDGGARWRQVRLQETVR